MPGVSNRDDLVQRRLKYIERQIALQNGTHSFSAHTAIGLTDTFFGFQNVTFDEIEIYAGGVNNAMVLDNVQLGNNATVAAPLPTPPCTQPAE